MRLAFEFFIEILVKYTMFMTAFLFGLAVGCAFVYPRSAGAFAILALAAAVQFAISYGAYKLFQYSRGSE